MPGEQPRLLVGNLPTIYRASNRLEAYNGFHRRFGEIVQIFWLWRSQISVCGYAMSMRMLVGNQDNYRKRRPNWILHRLFGHSVLSENGTEWRRHRMIVGAAFSAAHVTRFHDVFVTASERLAAKWEGAISSAGQPARLDVLGELTALFLDVIGVVAFGQNFGALDGRARRFLDALDFIVQQSTRPIHEFADWWQWAPTPSSRMLRKAFKTIDQFIMELVRSRREMKHWNESALLDTLLAATVKSSDNPRPLTDQEVRDNLLAILVNGHQTVAVSVAMTLDALSRRPDAARAAREEIDRAFLASGGQPTVPAISRLEYLSAAIQESLRLYPPVAGLQRIAERADVLEGWPLPAGQTVGISFAPLHLDPTNFGADPERFQPERYAPAGCPFRGHDAKRSVKLPLTFGAGSRRCLGEHFALYEMKVALAILLHRFDFEVSGTAPQLELERFGLFLSARPAKGVPLAVRLRRRCGAAESSTTMSGSRPGQPTTPMRLLTGEVQRNGY